MDTFLRPLIGCELYNIITLVYLKSFSNRSTPSLHLFVSSPIALPSLINSGLSEYDEATVIVMMAGGDGGFTDFKIVPDRLHQGMLNAIVLMRMVTSPAFVKDASVTFNGKQVISTSPSDRFYNGNSQGGIMGGVYMAVSPDVTRGVLGVGGGPYALLLPRSSDFSDLFTILKIRYPRSIDRMIILTLMQMLWDKMDPAGE
jgi:hypothetical protein